MTIQYLTEILIIRKLLVVEENCSNIEKSRTWKKLLEIKMWIKINNMNNI